MSISKMAGDIEFLKNTGIIWLFYSNVVCPNQISADAEALRKARLAIDAPMFLEDKRVGTCTAVRYSEAHQALMCYFKHEGIDIVDSELCLIGIANIRSKCLKCCICQKSFLTSSLPCRCIFRAPILILQDFVINSVTLTDARNDNIEQDSKNQILLQHFGGAISGLEP